MQLKHKCAGFLYVHSLHSDLSLNAKPPGIVSCDSQLPCQLQWHGQRLYQVFSERRLTFKKVSVQNFFS